MHQQLRGSKLELCVFQKREHKIYEDVFQAKCDIAASGLVQLTEELGCVPLRFGGYDWIRQKNGPTDRLERLSAMLLTQRATCSGGYRLPAGNQSIQLDLQEMCKGTQVLRAPEKLKRKVNDASLKTLVTWDETATVMEAAIKASQRSARVVAVNAASAFHVGGGVLTGGRHALEETWCTISTLLHALQEVQWKEAFARQSIGDSHSLSAAGRAVAHMHYGPMHVPVDGCIVSPDVVIFRETSAKGYAFKESETKLAGVCSVAMFNMNARVSDSPVDAPRDFEKYCNDVKQKFRAVVSGAVELKAEVLVCPDVGCGVFENDPHILGSLLGEVLCEQPGVVGQIVLTGKAAFASAARQVVEAGGIHQPFDKPKFFARVECEAPASKPLDLSYHSDPASMSTAAPHQTERGADAIVPDSEPEGGAPPRDAPGNATSSMVREGQAKAGQPSAGAKAKGPTKASGVGGCACCSRKAAAEQAIEPGIPKAQSKVPPKAAPPKATGPAAKAPVPANAKAPAPKAAGPVA